MERTKGFSLAKGPVGIIGAVLLAGGILGLLFGSTSFATDAPNGDVTGGTFLGIEGNGWTLLRLRRGRRDPAHERADALGRQDDGADRRPRACPPRACSRSSTATTCSASRPPTAATMLVMGAAGVALLVLAMLPRVGGRKRDVVVEDDDDTARTAASGARRQGRGAGRHDRAARLAPRRLPSWRPMEAATVTQTPFSLELSQDQRDIRDWVHGFAEGVVRPAAAEWDEREETPWPIIAEAQKIGLYGFEALAQFCADESGLTLPIVNEELFWGDAGIGMAIMGTSLAVGRDLRPGHRRADRRVDPAVLRHARGARGRRVLRVRARRRLRRLVAAHARGLRRGQGRVGPQRPEGVGDQRRHRRRARHRRVGRPRARLARPGGVRRPARHAPA